MDERQIEILEDREPYTRVFNELIMDGRLRLQTKMVLIMMLSKPPNWDFSIRGMATVAGVTKDTMSKMMKELEAAGYIRKKEQQRNENGCFAKTGYLVAGKPLFASMPNSPESSHNNYDTAEPCPNLSYTMEPYTINSPQEINKQEINKQENSHSLAIFDEAVDHIATLSAADDAAVVRDTIYLALEQLGFTCQHEVPVDARSNDPKYTGRISITAAKEGVIVAIEVDRKSPKRNSIYKLRNFSCDYRVIVLRGTEDFSVPDGIDAVVSIPVIGEEDLFQRFWDEYPKKVDKQKARKAFQKLSVTEDFLEVMLSELLRQKKSQEWRRDGGRYIPHASTWLNGHRWEDQGIDHSQICVQQEESPGGWAPDPEVTS